MPGAVGPENLTALRRALRLPHNIALATPGMQDMVAMWTMPMPRLVASKHPQI